MELTQKQKLKLENYRAHYNSILGNISIANGELENLLQIAKKAQLSLETAAEVAAVINSEKERFEQYKEKIFSEAADIAEAIIKKEQKLKEKEQLIKQYEHEVSEKLVKKEVHSEQVLRDYMTNITKVDEKLLILNDILNKKEKELDNIISLLGVVEKQLNKTTSRRRELEELMSEHKANHKKTLELSKKQLQEVEQKIKEEQLKVGSAKESIKQREKQLKIKEHDLYIITTRIRKKHKELFPEIGLQI